MKRPIAKPTKHLSRRERKGKPRRPQKMRCPAFGWLCLNTTDICWEYAPEGFDPLMSTVLSSVLLGRDA